MIGSVFKAGSITVVQGVENSGKCEKTDELRPGNQSILVPIKLGQTCIGVIEVINRQEEGSIEQDKKLIELIAIEIAPGVSKHINEMKKANSKENWEECNTLKDNYCKPILKSGLIALAEICKAEKYSCY
jgi:transcriptional regulator with GAF, ATPase, and Fis domain